MMLRVILSAALAGLLVVGAQPAEGQFGGLGKLAKGLGITAPNLRGQPISTSLADAEWGDPARDGFTPPGRPRELDENEGGTFTLRAGWWTIHNQSYCLHAGTHGPGGGDGYLYAPPEGTARDAVISVVRNSAAYPDIPQQSIQTLLWAIVARAKVEDLSAEHQAVAARLLTPRQLAGLNRSALDILSAGPIASNLPAPVRAVMQAEASLRSMLAGGSSFAELERVAVLTGAAPQGPGSREVPSGRWSAHPDGYFIRYLPRGYSNTVTEIWVPEGSAGVGATYDPATHIAVPGNTSRQRLIQSARVYSE